MAYCPYCGEYNEREARFCKRCGRPLPTSSQFDKAIHDFTQEMESLGRKAADAVESGLREIGGGGRVERAISPKPSSWSDATLGVAGPLIWSLLGILVLLLAIGLFLAVGEQGSALEKVGDFLLENVWLLLALSLLLSYAAYASRNYPLFRWLNPLSTAAALVFALWIAVEVMIIISVDQNIEILSDIGELFRGLLAFVFVVVLVVGYIFLVMTASRSVGHEEISPRSTGFRQTASQRSRRLYRSSENRMLGGVCGGIAEYVGTDPTLIRILWIIGLLLSLGLAILAYLICWIIIPRDPSRRWD
jgi:phage shock protein C